MRFVGAHGAAIAEPRVEQEARESPEEHHADPAQTDPAQANFYNGRKARLEAEQQTLRSHFDSWTAELRRLQERAAAYDRNIVEHRRKWAM